MAYKVTNRDNGSFILMEEVRYYTKYKLGEYVQSEYPLFVYKYLEDARKFVKSYNGILRLYRCKTKKLSMQSRCCKFRHGYPVSLQIRDFWNSDNFFEEIYTPRGTYIASQVMLTKEIKNA